MVYLDYRYKQVAAKSNRALPHFTSIMNDVPCSVINTETQWFPSKLCMTWWYIC